MSQVASADCRKIVSKNERGDDVPKRTLAAPPKELADLEEVCCDGQNCSCGCAVAVGTEPCGHSSCDYCTSGLVSDDEEEDEFNDFDDEDDEEVEGEAEEDFEDDEEEKEDFNESGET